MKSSQQWIHFSDSQIATILGIQENQASDFGKVKGAFRRKMIKLNHQSKDRVNLSNAYCEAVRKMSNLKTNNILKFINNKEISNLEKIFQKDPKLIDQNYYSYKPIYYAVRAGHYDVVEYLLRKGCSIKFEGQKSTPMHAAAFYGHYSLIPLLLAYGIPTDITNFSDNKPIDEAATDAISNLLKEAHLNKINILQESLLSYKLVISNINIYDCKKKTEIVAKKILLHNYVRQFPSDRFVDAFHGTSYGALESIAKNGLKKPGDIVDGKRLKPVEGHISEGVEIGETKDWAKAIFVSPSIYYAAHPVYSKQFITNSNDTWLPLIQAKVKKGTYSSHDHTLSFYDSKCDEPRSLQYRVEYREPEQCPKQLVWRSQENNNVQVVAIILLRKGYLETHENYLETTQLMLSSPEELRVQSKIK